MQPRYAIYYAPQKGSELESFGQEWLGRDAETGHDCEQIAVSGLSPERLREITKSPRHYGFHGTVVPPFVLDDGYTAEDLVGRAESFAREQQPFDFAPLSVKSIGSFIALVPSGQAGISRLAEAGLRHFHPLRKQPADSELEQRRAKGLTPNQERLLARWWYPYVLDEFRFHLTLTGAIEDKAERQNVLQVLTELTESLTWTVNPVREVCIFHQADRLARFTMLHRCPLGPER